MKKAICIVIVLLSLFLVSCGAPKKVENKAAPFASATYHAAIETPSRILLVQTGALWYYSKADGESYRFCFDPLCQHTINENCVSLFFSLNSATKDQCVYSEKNNRFYFSRGQNIYSTSFDASDLKLEYSFGEEGLPESKIYYSRIQNMRMYDDYLFFCRSDDTYGKNQIVRYNTKTRKAEEMTSAEDEWVIGYEIAEDYIYFKSLNADNSITFFTTDMDFKERKIVDDPIDPTSLSTTMGIYDGKYFYKKVSDELYKINPLTGEKQSVIKNEEMFGNSTPVCINGDGLYFVKWDEYTVGYGYNDSIGNYNITTEKNSVWKMSFDGTFLKVFDLPRGDIKTVNLVDGGVIIGFGPIYHKEINVKDPEYIGGAFIFFDIDENGYFVNPRPIGNHAENEELIKFLKGV